MMCEQENEYVDVNTESNIESNTELNTELEEMQSMYDFWVDNMYLVDWDTSIEVLDNGNFAVKSDTPYAEGENTIYDHLKISEIIIKKDSDLDREFILVHELAHLIPFKFLVMIDKWLDFFPQVMHTMIQKDISDCNETVTNHIAKALLATRNAAFDEGYETAMNEIGLIMPKVDGYSNE